MSAHAIGNRDRRARDQSAWLCGQHQLMVVLVECQGREWLRLSLFEWLLVRCRGHRMRSVLDLTAITTRRESIELLVHDAVLEGVV